MAAYIQERVNAISTLVDPNHNRVNQVRNNQQQNRVRQVDNPQRQIACIDREINIKERYVKTLDNHINLIKENTNLRKEYIQTLRESCELDTKRMSLMGQQIKLLQESKETLQNTNDKLQALLDRGQGLRTVSAKPILQTKAVELNGLNGKLTSLSKQEAVIKEQTVLVDAKVDKLAMKVDYTEKQLVRLEAQSNGTEVSRSQVKQDKTVFAHSYKPTDNQIAKLELSKNKQDIKDLDAVFQQRAVNSQKNIYESIMSKVIADKLTKLL